MHVGRVVAVAVLCWLGAAAPSAVSGQSDEFRDDFSRSGETGWVVVGAEDGWETDDEGAISGRPAFFVNESREWGDAEIEVEVADLNGVFNLNFRSTPNERTYVSLSSVDGIGVEVRSGHPGEPISDRVVVPAGPPFTVAVVDRDDVVIVSVDGDVVLEATRDEPAPRGFVSLENTFASEVRVAWIVVRSLEPADVRPDIPDVVGDPLGVALVTLEAIDELQVDVEQTDVDIDEELVVVRRQFNDVERWMVTLQPGTFVPDLDGMSLADAEDEVRQHVLVLESSGDGGRVVGQSPAPGTPVGFGDTVAVTLETTDDPTPPRATTNGDDEDGSGVPPWVVGLGGAGVIVGGGLLAYRVLRSGKTQPEPEPEPDPKTQARVSAELRLGRTTVDVDPSDLARQGTVSVVSRDDEARS